MSLLDRVTRGLTPEATSLSQPSDWLRSILLGTGTYSGRKVTPESSLALVPVFSAVSQLAGAVGSTPLRVMERLERGRRPAPGHRMQELLGEKPNPEMAGDELWEFVEASLELWGNAFLAKVYDELGLVTELWPLKPDRCAVGRDQDGKRIFTVDDQGPYTEADIVHIRAFGTDGLVGLSPIQACKNAIANGLSLEEFAGRFWSNSARPGGVLQHPNELSEKAAKRLRKSWDASQGGLANVARTAVLEEGMEWKSMGMPLNDAQFVDQAKFSRTEIALLFNLPPHRLAAEAGSSLTYSTTEAQSLDLVKWTLRRRFVRIENSLARDPYLFLPSQPFFPKFNLDAMLRADLAARYRSYNLGYGRWLTRNEVRELENLNPVEGGDELPDFTASLKLDTTDKLDQGTEGDEEEKNS